MPRAPTILITGCSDGSVGSALALAFQAKGFIVFATARHCSSMSALSGIDDIRTLELDLSDEDSIQSLAKQILGAEELQSGLDVLLNNAGVNHFYPLVEDDIGEAKRVFEVNTWGTLALTQALLPSVIQAKGVLCCTLSTVVFANVPYMSTYAASKAALKAFFDGLRVEVRPFDVSVISFIPPSMKSHGLDSFADLNLPENSRYKPIESHLRATATGELRAKNITTSSEYAQWAVEQVENTIGGKFGGLKWGKGSPTGFVRFAAAWLPTWLLDYLLAKGAGLSNLTSSS